MSKEFNIFSEDDFDLMVEKFKVFFKARSSTGKPFQKIKIISKRWQGPKSSKQHRAYWRAIGELKKIFIKNGYDTNESETHEFIKKKAGFTKMLAGEMVTCSIADASDDATSESLNRLIEFIQRFAAETFGENIQIGDELF